MQTRILWFLIYFVSTEGFGMRLNSWGGLGAASLGWFGALQIVVAAISVAAIAPGLNYLVRNRKSGIGAVVLSVGLLPIYMVCVTLVRGILGFNVGLQDIFSSLIQLKLFLLIYLFAYLISRKDGFINSLRTMAFYALVSSIIIIVIVTFGIKTDVSQISTSADVTRFYRVIFPGAFLVAMGWLIFFYRYLFFGGSGNIAASLVCLGATVVQLHRSTLVAVCATIFMFAYWFVTTHRLTTITRKLILIGLSGVVALGAAHYLSLRSKLGLEYLLASISEVLGLTSNSGHRVNIVANSWNYIFSDTFGLGLGLDWDRIYDLGTYLRDAFVAGPTYDSTYANIIIVLGLPGVAIFVWLFCRLAGLTRWKYMTREERPAQMYALFLRSFLVYSLVIGLGTDIVFLSSASATFVLILVSAVRFQELQSNGRFLR